MVEKFCEQGSCIFRKFFFELICC